MADEISRTIALNWSKGGASLNLAVSYKTNQTGSTAIENVQVIGGTSEAILFGDVTDPGVLGFKNLITPWSGLTAAQKVTETSQAIYEAANIVHVGTATPCTSSNATFSFVPGAGHTFDTVQTAWYAIRGTNNVNLLVMAIQR